MFILLRVKKTEKGVSDADHIWFEITNKRRRDARLFSNAVKRVLVDWYSIIPGAYETTSRFRGVENMSIRFDQGIDAEIIQIHEYKKKDELIQDLLWYCKGA